MEVGREDDKQRSRHVVTLMCIWQYLRVCDGDDHFDRAAVARA